MLIDPKDQAPGLSSESDIEIGQTMILCKSFV